MQSYVASKRLHIGTTDERIAKEYIIKGRLLENSIEEKFKGFYWLLDQKYKAIDDEDFEQATSLMHSLEELESVLFPYRQAEEYCAMLDFLTREEDLEDEQAKSKYERFLLNVIDTNVSITEEMPLVLLDLQMKIWPIKFIEQNFDKVSEFSNYLELRDANTKLRNEYGLRRTD